MSCNNPGHYKNLSEEQREILKECWGQFLERNQDDALMLAAQFEHPDSLLLRYLRARKWNVEKAVAMASRSVTWRQENIHKLLIDGEGAIDHEILTSGVGYFHGKDKQGRPVCFIHARLHDKNAGDPKMLENHSLLQMETARMLISEENETTVTVFDLTQFGLSNMDYGWVKFLVTTLESYYPESLGQILIVNAPWVFNACWAVIKAWIDPVVADKIKFIAPRELLEHVDLKFIPKLLLQEFATTEQIEDGFEFKYQPPTAKETERMESIRNDKVRETKAREAFKTSVAKFRRVTQDWVKFDDPEVERVRDETVKDCFEAYKGILPFIQRPSHYHRVCDISMDLFT